MIWVVSRQCPLDTTVQLSVRRFFTVLCRNATITGSRAVFLGLCAASLLLAGVTFVVWQSRFERVGAPQNDSFADGSAGWKVTGEGVTFEKAEGRSTTVKLTRMPGRPAPIVTRALDAGSQGYVWIRCEFACHDLRAGTIGWQLGRVICYGTDEAGRGMYSREHYALEAEGTQPWQKNEVVFELDPRMKHVWIALQNLGNAGVFEMRDFDVAYVRNRPALNWQVPLLILGWGIWLVALMRLGLGVKAPVWRCAPGSALTLLLFWFLALPGIRTTSRPLASGSFVGLQTAAAPSPLNVATRSTGGQTRTDKVGPTARSPDHEIAFPPTTASPETVAAPVPRHKQLLAWVSRTWDWLHAVVFFGLSIALLILTGTGAVWRISAAMALLIQGAEWLEYGKLEWDDLREVFAAGIGIAFAMWLWNWLRKRRERAEESVSVSSS